MGKGQWAKTKEWGQFKRKMLEKDKAKRRLTKEEEYAEDQRRKRMIHLINEDEDFD